ncbi:hypothetical protein BUALT_Bualt12G0099700 [Buddleja alternifolia]|uniref:F-box domain-containing protein n=1 Tax=Buddleja alternifolia TaxID=168488 RepID=A0AAV6WY18_9LAMI|nr:hypothetical protein BUALT_Bualt12G0099700 [Buddleja alternifolia]
MENEEGGISSVFWVLPEGCVSNIISFTSPKDACRASAVSLGFKFAVDSDLVWERFLPSDYQDIIARSVSPIAYSNKKDLYFILCQSPPLLLDHGNLSFNLSKPDGKKCYMLPSRELHITWIDTPMYWKLTPLPESRFGEVAQLVMVCWIEIRGTIQSQILSPKTEYEAYLVFKTDEVSSGLDCSSKASIKFVKGNLDDVEEQINTVYLLPPTHRHVMRRGRWRREPVTQIHGLIPKNRIDGWMEIKLGEFFIDGEGEEGDIVMQLLEIENGNWKTGLFVEGIEIRPKQPL